MSISRRLKWYLDHHGAHYQIVPHPHTACSRETAQAAHVPEECLAKSVLLEDERGYLMVVLPASRRLDLRDLKQLFDRRFDLATEPELGRIFEDCEVGAVPAVGSAYGVHTVIDDSLLGVPEVYFEAGDHEDLVRMPGADFLMLMSGSSHGRFSRPD